MRANLPSIPNFTDPTWQARQSDAQLVASVLEGSGARMPAFRGRIDTETAHHLISYIRTLGPTRTRLTGFSSTDFEARFRQLEQQFRELERRSRELSPPVAQSGMFNTFDRPLGEFGSISSSVVGGHRLRRPIEGPISIGAVMERLPPGTTPYNPRGGGEAPDGRGDARGGPGDGGGDPGGAAGHDPPNTEPHQSRRPRPRTTGPPAPHAAFVRRRDSPPRPSGRVATAAGANQLDGAAVGHQGRGSDPLPEALEDATGMKVIGDKGGRGGSCLSASQRGLDRGARAAWRGVHPARERLTIEQRGDPEEHDGLGDVGPLTPRGRVGGRARAL